MELVNCTICGRAMQRGLRNICQACAEKKEKDFLKVRDFIKDNPKVAIEVVVEATGVPETEVRQFIREGLIESTAVEGTSITCNRCGRPIANGVYCALCKQEFGSHEDGTAEDKGKARGKKPPRHSLTLEYKRRK